MANKRYQIWNKTDNIFTPSGAKFTPAQWIEQYGWIEIPAAVPVIAAGMINGAFCGELSEMKSMAENMGAIFEDGLTDEEVLDAIVDYEDSLNNIVDDVPSAEERIAAALEYQIMASMPDEEM